MVRAQTPSPDQLESRRLKNREYMRKVRQRQRRQLQEMESTVQQLEGQYVELCQQATSAAQNAEVIVHERPEGQDQDYTEVVMITKRLGAEKLLLQTALKQKAEWRRQFQRILDFEASSVTSTPGFQATFNFQLDSVDEAEAAEVFGFHPLTEWDFTRTLLDNKQDIRLVAARLLQASEFDEMNGTRTHRMQAFDWDIVQRVEGSVMEFVFTKNFVGLDVLDILQKTWVNNMQLAEFKKIKAETRCLRVLQQVNPNAFVFVRDVGSPSEISIFRSVFTRFLVESTAQVHPFDSDEDLTGTGYVLGTQSVDTHCPQHPTEEESSGKVAWADLTLSIEALDVVNPSTGETFQHIRWIGRTDYCSEEHALRDAADTLQSMLRWEMLMVAPALNLVSLSQH
ncbi:hypothetical protein PRNP1_011759 [Phytophthora ramorum]